MKVVKICSFLFQNMQFQGCADFITVHVLCETTSFFKIYVTITFPLMCIISLAKYYIPVQYLFCPTIFIDFFRDSEWAQFHNPLTVLIDLQAK